MNKIGIYFAFWEKEWEADYCRYIEKAKKLGFDVLELAAGFAILLGLFGKFGATLQTIPVPVMGGVSILLFGMIASIGIRTLAESNLDFSHSRNLIIVALILVVGLGLSAGVSIGGFQISGLFLAVVLGAVANQLFPAEV